MEKGITLSISETERIAELARLEFSEKEKEKICSELGEMVLFASELKRVANNSPEKELEGACALAELRADEPSAGLAREELLEAARDKADGFIRVPRVIEESES